MSTNDPALPAAARALLSETAASWGLCLAAAQLEQFATYAAELQRWNERINLTAITDPTQIVLRHFLDALVCACYWGDTPRSLVDIGSGAGFPGIPLKLAYRHLHLTLIESVGKKATFLQHIVDTLGLQDVSIVQARAEAAGRDPQQRERYDVATARAVAALPVLAEYALPLLRIGGRLLAPKGASIEDEQREAAPALARLGGRVQASAPVHLPTLEERTMVVIVKTSATPAAYPRAVGVPARRPL
jgi:16S rRNA (guanine527-N7)-methyltransferase